MKHVRRFTGLGALTVLLAFPVLAADVEIEWVPLDWEHAAIENGSELYVELCAVCHGEDGKGGGPAAPALKSELPDLTVLALRNGGDFPAARVDRIIRGERTFVSHGTREMPVWGHAFYDVRPDWRRTERKEFVEEKVHSLVSFLQTLQEGTGDGSEPAPE